MGEQDKERINSQVGRYIIRDLETTASTHDAETEAVNQNPHIGTENDRIERQK
ncbi:hypothetical protein [Ammoniphilus sp. YIM 78166]|uniref:hypothetical protein n=1 Tax=Ammoniphilus sp. YIM 78166 TaxID=1644106 RepID=UPI0014302795|nr:hypothetical protein [Ammoniphilus sp. YIM 78166]